MFFTVTVSAQENVLFTVEGEPIYIGEFRYVYNKNAQNNKDAFTKNDIDEYLELFKNFKLKIYHAKQLGLDTLSELKEEFETYSRQLKKPYLTDEKIKEKLINEAYERYQWEVNASHILLLVEPEAPPADTLDVWNRVMSLRNRALQGEKFDSLAIKFSEDPSAANNGGNLGYFTSMQMVYPFESAAYNTKPGSISLPVRTRFGYHIIKVHEKRPSKGKVKVSHIVLRKTQKDSVDNDRNKIYEIYDHLNAGLEWEEAVRLYSEDPSTRNNAGKINRTFTAGQLPPNYSTAAFSLDNPGDFSDPLETENAWYIVRLEEKIPVEPFDEMEQIIRQKIGSDQRSEIEHKHLVEKLKQENNFVESRENMKTLNEMLSAGEDIPADLLLFKIDEEEYYYSDFINFSDKKEINKKTFKPLYKEFTQTIITEYEEKNLDEKYPEYRYLRNEYREGILLFKLMEDSVWNKAASDSAGLRKFYIDNKQNYRWASRMKGYIFSTADKMKIDEIYKYRNDRVSWDSIGRALDVELRKGLFEKNDDKILYSIPWEEGIHEVKDGNIYYLVAIDEIMEPSAKRFEECTGLVMSDYQDFLDKKFIDRLKGLYHIEVNKKVLRQVYDELVH